MKADRNAGGDEEGEVVVEEGKRRTPSGPFPVPFPFTFLCQGKVRGSIHLQVGMGNWEVDKGQRTRDKGTTEATIFNSTMNFIKIYKFVF